ncbi:MAG: ubiquinone/menaquinone biosynthesis methyltransferase [Acidobacteria bacterium]|nr:ubiquinone/menaquinone biosynthesis methyltransferase [Acidobacteriota bacterium]
MVLTEAERVRGDGSGAMFDRIAARYDLLNRLISLGWDRRWRRIAAEAVALDGGTRRPPRVLDVASGTGDLAIEIARRYPGAAIHGIDASRGMTEIGRRKVDQAGFGDRITLDAGDALELPFADHSFDAVTIAFGIRNIPDRSRALREMARVTRPGGRVAILEAGEPSAGLTGALARFHIHVIVPFVGGLLAGAEEYRYLERSIRAFPPVPEFVCTMAAAGLEEVETRSLTFGVCSLFLGRPAAASPLGADT